MASSNLNLNQVGFKSQLRSKPVRENFQDLENNFNALRTEVYASIASTASEVTSARDNFNNLSDNIQIRKVNGNNLFGSSFVSQSATPDMKVSVSAGTGIIGGVGVDWDSAVSGTITAPSTAGLYRVDLVTANTDNSISIVSGDATSATASFPSFSTASKEQMAALILTAGTTSLNDNVQIFNLKKRSIIPDILVNNSVTLNQGVYKWNNAIVNATISIDCSSTSPEYIINHRIFGAKCDGNFYLTQDGTIIGTAVSFVGGGKDGDGGTVNGTLVTTGGAGGAIGYKQNIKSDLSGGIGGIGKRDSVWTGSGGGGGGSVVSAGGNGGDSGSGGGGVTGTSDAVGGFPGCAIILSADNMILAGEINSSGFAGADGATGVGGGGGGAGGSVAFYTRETLNATLTIDTSGGAGGSSNNGGGGGGGGAGGLLLLRYASITDNITHVLDGGTGGSDGGGGGATGSDGSDGVKLSEDYNDVVTAGHVWPYDLIGE